MHITASPLLHWKLWLIKRMLSQAHPALATAGASSALLSTSLEAARSAKTTTAVQSSSLPPRGRMRCNIGSFPAAAASKIQGDLYLGFSALSLAALAKSRARSFAALSVLSHPDCRHRKDSGGLTCLTFRVAHHSRYKTRYV